MDSRFRVRVRVRVEFNTTKEVRYLHTCSLRRISVSFASCCIFLTASSYSSPSILPRLRVQDKLHVARLLVRVASISPSIFTACPSAISSAQSGSSPFCWYRDGSGTDQGFVLLSVLKPLIKIKANEANRKKYYTCFDIFLASALSP